MIGEYNGVTIVFLTPDQLMRWRQAQIIALGAIEDALELERSIVPRHRRERRRVVPHLRATDQLREDLR